MPNNAQQILEQARTAEDSFGHAVTRMTVIELQLLIDKADVAYHRPGSSEIMTNAEYDLLRPALKKLSPDDERIDRVGLPFDEGELRNKVAHRIPMGSLDNTEDGVAGFEPWMDTVVESLETSNNPVIFASLKVDGGSICATYEDGKLVRVATRGDGAIGGDITVNGANFKHLPTVLPEPLTMDVRGEAVMYKDEYKKVRSRDAGIPFDQILEADRSNPRNIGNGVFSRDDGQDSERITFIAFNVENGHQTTTEENKMEFLKSQGFQPVPYKICKTIADFEDFYEVTLEERDRLPFEIDGIVVVLNDISLHAHFITDDIKTRLRPKFARAVKFPHKANTTTIESVILSLGHTGGIYPTAVLKEVRVGGVNVTHALLNNWNEIERLNVAIGDEVEVILAGDIIPKVIRCVTESPDREIIEEPKRCPSCGEPTTRNYRGKRGAVTYCSQPNQCPQAVIGKIDKWIGSSKKGVGILNVGGSILKAMWDNNVIGDAADLYTITADQLENLVMDSGTRIGRSRAETIINNIAGKKNLKLEVFLGSLGIDLLGRRRVIILRKAAGGRLDALENWRDDTLALIEQVDGLGDTIRESVVHGMKESSDLIDKLLTNGVTIDCPEIVVETKIEATNEDTNGEPDPNKPFTGLTFCITGTRAYMSDVEARGGVFTTGVAKSKPSPDFLIQKDPLKISNKTKNADANGHTQVIGLDYLKKVIDGQAELPAKNETPEKYYPTGL